MRMGRSSRTAEQVALARAVATFDGPADRICDDPIALGYLGPTARAMAWLLRPELVKATWVGLHRLLPFNAGHLYVAARVAFVDRALLRYAHDGLDQLVLLGAGFDSRAERFAGDLGTARVFEIDFPATQAQKLKRRPAAPGVTYLALDLAREPFEPALLHAGFDPAKRSVFLWEGVVYYLHRAQAETVLHSIRSLLQPGGGLLLDYLVDPPREELSRPFAALLAAAFAGLRVLGEPIETRFAPEEVRPFFERPGFAVRDQADTEELERRHLRGRYAGVRLLPIWGCLDLTAR